MIKQIELSVSAVSGSLIGNMLIIIVLALTAFQSSEMSQFLQVWPIQKAHIVVQYSLALRDLLLFAPLHPKLTIFRTLFGVTALSV